MELGVGDFELRWGWGLGFQIGDLDENWAWGLIVNGELGLGI